MHFKLRHHTEWSSSRTGLFTRRGITPVHMDWRLEGMYYKSKYFASVRE